MPGRVAAATFISGCRVMQGKEKNMVSTTTQKNQVAPGLRPAPAGVRMGRQNTGKRGLKKIFVCSPFHPAGETREERDKDLKRNLSLAENVCRYAVEKGYVPYAPHLYFPQFLSENDPEEREMGIVMGLSWLVRCDEVWVAGFRISEGMGREIAQAQEWGIPVKAYVPIPGAKNRVFDAEFFTEEDFYRMLGEKG